MQIKQITFSAQIYIYIKIYFWKVKGYDRSFDNDKQTQVESYLPKKSMKGQLHQVMKMAKDYE